MSRVKDIQMEQMTQLREISRNVSVYLEKQLNKHIQTLMPLFSPRKVWGEYMEGSNAGKVPGAKANYDELQEKFQSIMLNAFGVSDRISGLVPLVSGKLTLSQWRTIETISGKPLMIVDPLKWVLSYDAPLSQTTIVEAKHQHHELDSELLGRFVLANLTLNKLFAVKPDLSGLFTALGFQAQTLTQTHLSGETPYIVLSAPLETFRPQDDLVTMATQFSGSTSFELLLDKEAIDALPNVMQHNLLALL